MTKKRPILLAFRSILSALTFIFVSIFSSSSWAQQESQFVIGFGSCANQNQPQRIWNSIAKHQPALFIAMGDNVYIDSDDPVKMQQAYSKLAENPNYQKFTKKVPIIATWDDHDYGSGDGGKEFSGKHLAKQAFKKFYDYPEVNNISDEDVGIFHSRWLDYHGKKIHIIMLDTRWYRDPLVYSYLNKEQRKTLNLGPYQPVFNNKATLLGETQWHWLENELSKKADLIVLVSSIQVLNEYSGWEIWANFPHERQRLLQLITDKTDNNLVILSGDVHRAEITQLEFNDKRLLEITSSGLAVRTYPASINHHRVGEAINALNFGILTISIKNEKLILNAEIFDSENNKRLSSSMEIK